MKVKLTAGFVVTAGAPSNGKDRVIYWDETRATLRWLPALTRRSLSIHKRGFRRTAGYRILL